MPERCWTQYTSAMPHRLTVADVMTRDVITLDREDSLADARRSMDQARVRHLPVVAGGRLVGLITHRDLLAASLSVFSGAGEREQRRLFAQIPVRELMHDAVGVTPTTPVREAARILIESKFGCLPVVGDGDVLVGIVTEADFVRLAATMLDAIQA